MSVEAEAFTGLRPVKRRNLGQDLGGQTKRILLPHSSANAAMLPTVEPAPAVRVPKVVIKKHFSLVPVVASLLEILPNGVPLSSGWLFIGSNPSMEIAAFMSLVLHVDGVSKVHAAVTEYKNKAFVTDLGSTNGTRIVRGIEPIEVGKEPIELHADDVLWLGPASFQVVQS